jgi:hypothetical protein
MSRKRGIFEGAGDGGRGGKWKRLDYEDENEDEDD